MRIDLRRFGLGIISWDRTTRDVLTLEEADTLMQVIRDTVTHAPITVEHLVEVIRREAGMKLRGLSLLNRQPYQFRQNRDRISQTGSPTQSRSPYDPRNWRPK